MHRVTVRTLSRDLLLHTDCDEAFAALSYISADPVMPESDRPGVNLTVERFGKFYRIEPPGRGTVEGSLDTILNGLFRLLGAWIVEDAGGAPMLHAAIVTVDGHRFAFLGDKGFGKTTLVLKLIEEGAAVEGDEHVVIREKGAIARPRRLHVKESSLAIIPTLSDQILAAPSVTDWMGDRVFACRPSLCGVPWEITERPIEYLVFIEPNFGGSSVLSPLPHDEAFARLLKTAFMPAEQLGKAAARLRMLSIDARTWRLQVGDLNQAVWHLRKAGQLG